MKKSGFSMLLLLICVSMLSVMPVSAARKKSRYDLQFSDLKVPVGFISAIHGKFCDTCNRVRLTAEGYLKLCLCYDEGEDLRRVLREGEKENLRTIMEQTIFRKPAAHCFEHPAEMTETHEMVKIGG